MAPRKTSARKAGAASKQAPLEVPNVPRARRTIRGVRPPPVSAVPTDNARDGTSSSEINNSIHPPSAIGGEIQRFISASGRDGTSVSSIATDQNSGSNLSRSEIDMISAEIIRRINNVQDENRSLRMEPHTSLPSPSLQDEAIKSSDYTALKVLVDVIPAFTGRNISVQHFSRECRFAEQGVALGLRPLFLKMLRGKLKGEAELCVKNKDYMSLNELLDSLFKVFGTPESLFQIQSEIAHISQNPGESILSYGARVGELLNKMIELTEQQSSAEVATIKIREYNSEVANCFRLGLEGELEARVRQAAPTNLQEAINAAIKAERDLAHHKRLRGGSMGTRSTLDKDLDNYIIRDLPSNSLTRSVHQIDERARGPPTKNKSLECFNCGKEGHIARKCPHNTQTHRQKTNEEKCSYCGGWRHKILDCYKRRAELAEEQLGKMNKKFKSTHDRNTDTLNSKAVRSQGAAANHQSHSSVRQSNESSSQSGKRGQ